MYKKIIIILILCFLAVQPVAAQTLVPTIPTAKLTEAVQLPRSAPVRSERYFEIQALDTMKYSRDRARNPYNEVDIPHLVYRVSQMRPTHIAINTPYDEEFIPILRLWVQESRKYNLKIWYRGNFSAFEGWFGYPKMSNPNEHHTKTAEFIRTYPEFFQEGDIFTPAPEPENGAIGDPRVSSDGGDKFNQWLIESYTNCNTSMTAINSKTKCGYYSTNGDVAWSIKPETYKAIGNVIVIDHFVKTTDRFRDDIKKLNQEYGVKVMIGEFGAPIPDIHGTMTEDQQAEFIRVSLQELIKMKDIIHGVNYWTAFDGTTTIHRQDFSRSKAGEVVKQYYSPVVYRGRVQDILFRPVANATVKTSLQETVKTDKEGYYTVLAPNPNLYMSVVKDGFKPYFGTVTTKVTLAPNIF